MTTRSIANITLRAKGLEDGPVTDQEVESARQVLRQRGEGIIDAIHIIGLCGGADDRPLLETYLQGDENDVLAEYALKALCRYLQLTDRYRPLLRGWMKDKNDEFRRLSAIHLAKEYFHNFEDDELGQYLIDVLCDLDDSCRTAVQGAFVAILNMKKELADPYGLQFKDWDADTTLIVKAAAARFNDRRPLLLSGCALH